MVIIQTFSKKFFQILKDNSQLLKERKLSPNAVMKYGLSHPEMVLVAIENKKVVGFIIGYSKLKKCSILTIFVKADFRNKKIGTLLLTTLTQQFNKLWTVRLRSIDFYIIDFFKKCKFHVIEELSLYKMSDIEFNRVKRNHINIRAIKDYEIINDIMRIEKMSFTSFWHKTEEEWRNILDDINAIVFIALFKEDSGMKVIGFNHNSINKENGVSEGQYIRVAVDPEFRKSGVATALTYEAFNFFKRNKVSNIYLSTISKNRKLNEMYKRWGFKLFDNDIILGFNSNIKKF